MADHTTTDAVSRRNVLKTAGGLLAGSTMLVGTAVGRFKPFKSEVEEATEKYIAVRVSIVADFYERVTERGALPERVFLGLADDFIVREDTVSLPENATEVLARPVELERLDEQTVMMAFRTEDMDIGGVPTAQASKLGLGIFTERAMPVEYFTTMDPIK